MKTVETCVDIGVVGCNAVRPYRQIPARFWWTYYLHFQAMCSSKTSVSTYKSIQHDYPEDKMDSFIAELTSDLK
jgi:hypothetical protein